MYDITALAVINNESKLPGMLRCSSWQQHAARGTSSASCCASRQGASLSGQARAARRCSAPSCRTLQQMRNIDRGGGARLLQQLLRGPRLPPEAHNHTSSAAAARDVLLALTDAPQVRFEVAGIPDEGGLTHGLSCFLL